MAAFFHLRVLAADRAFYDGDCESLTVPTSDGELGILAHHSNLVAAVIPGALRARLPDGRFAEAAISGGLLKVEDGDVLLLADSVERPEEIDAERARRAEARAREALLQQRSIQEYRGAQAHLARALNRLKLSGGGQGG